MDPLIIASSIASKSPNSRQIPGEHYILIVDDYAANLLIARAMLDEFGYKYDVASTGVSALELYAKNSYSVILMDVQMPEMNGLEATRKIRIYELKNKLLATPIIALTANTSPNIREECMDCGMNGFLAKPYLAKSLHDAISKYMVN